MATFFMSTWWEYCQKMQENEIVPRWIFKLGQPIQPIQQQFFVLSRSALNKPLWVLNFLHIFAIPLSSRHAKRCQILESQFQNSIIKLTGSGLMSSVNFITKSWIPRSITNPDLAGNLEFKMTGWTNPP